LAHFWENLTTHLDLQGGYLESLGATVVAVVEI